MTILWEEMVFLTKAVDFDSAAEHTEMYAAAAATAAAIIAQETKFLLHAIARSSIALLFLCPRIDLGSEIPFFPFSFSFRSNEIPIMI